MTRLDSLAPQLAEKLRKASDLQRRAACREACIFAVQKSALDDPAAHQALQTLIGGVPLDDELQKHLTKLLEQLDELYFEFREAGQENDVTVFSKARAVAALLSAYKVNSFDAATESIYEASSVVDDPTPLFQLVGRLVA